MCSGTSFAALLLKRCTLLRPRETNVCKKDWHAMASRVTVISVLLVNSELTKQELVTAPMSVQSVLQV